MSTSSALHTAVHTVVESPIDALRVVVRDGAVRAIEFADDEGRFHIPRLGEPAGERDDDDPLLRRAAEQLTAYFEGRLTAFDLPLAPQGSLWQQQVWEQLRGIGYAETASYGEIARRLGRSNAASRAVGLANGRNPIPVVVPCHRVVGADGTLTGYAGGLRRKQVLLDLEQGALF